MRALRKMKRGKALGPLGVATDLLRYAGENGVRELKKVFEVTETEERAPTAWGTSYAIPIYKGKGEERGVDGDGKWRIKERKKARRKGRIKREMKGKEEDTNKRLR